MAKLPKGLDHARAFALIKPYVSFNYAQYKFVKRKVKGKTKRVRIEVKHSSAEKAKVSKYFQLIYGGKASADDENGEPGLQSSPRYHLKKKLSPKQRRIAEEYARIPPGYPELKGVLIPVANEGDKPKIKFKKTKDGVPYLAINEDSVESNVIPFYEYEDYPNQVLDEPVSVVSRALKDDPTGKNYRIICGRAMTGNTYARSGIAKKVAHFFETYDDAEKWCTGIVSYTYKRKMSWDQYNRDLYDGKVLKQGAAKLARKAAKKKKPSAKGKKHVRKSKRAR